MIAKFKSCFVVEVHRDKESNVARIIDSAHAIYVVDLKNEKLLEKFKLWFKNVFKAGIAQTLTIVQYESVALSECDIELQITDFIKTSLQ